MGINPARANRNGLDALGSKLSGVLGNLNVQAGLCDGIGHSVINSSAENDFRLCHAASNMSNLLKLSLFNQRQESIRRPRATINSRFKGLLVKLPCFLDIKGHL